MRTSIVEYLKSREFKTLKQATATAEAPEGSGLVTSNVDEGQIVLVPRGRRLADGIRVVWSKDETLRERALPAGDYVVRHYNAQRRDDDGRVWAVRATGQGRAVTVRSGERVAIELDLDVTFTSSSGAKPAGVMVGGSFAGDSGMGLSLMKGTRRIDPAWKVLDGDRELASGTAAYG